MESFAALPDADLFALVKAGEHAAFAAVYERYWAVLYRYARRLLQDDEAARDVVQDIFVMFWQKAPALELSSGLSSFLYASVRNKILKLFARDKVHSKYLGSLENFLETGSTITDDMLRERELAARIEMEIGLLPAKMREVFLLSRKEGLSHREIAEQLGISETTVKTQVYNAMKTLRVRLGSLLSSALLLL